MRAASLADPTASSEFSAGSGASIKAGWCRAAAAVAAAELSGSADGKSAPNELLALWRERCLEAIDLLLAGGVGASSAYDGVLPPGAPSAADKDPPAPPMVKRWRKMDRQWPCWSMAFAVPSGAALDLIARHAPIVEMGAGTGFWVSLLRSRGLDATAFDVQPPRRPDDRTAHRVGGMEASKSNEFHGGCPAFVDVLKGSPSTLSSPRWRDHALLLCYPPPAHPMAMQSLTQFSGSTLIHVGEWRGDTAEPRFEEALSVGWALVERMPLPCWGDTMEDLTVRESLLKHASKPPTRRT